MYEKRKNKKSSSTKNPDSIRSGYYFYEFTLCCLHFAQVARTSEKNTIEVLNALKELGMAISFFVDQGMIIGISQDIIDEACINLLATEKVLSTLVEKNRDQEFSLEVQCSTQLLTDLIIGLRYKLQVLSSASRTQSVSKTCFNEKKLH